MLLGLYKATEFGAKRLLSLGKEGKRWLQPARGGWIPPERTIQSWPGAMASPPQRMRGIVLPKPARCRLLPWCIVRTAFALSVANAWAMAQQAVSFNNDVLPILASNCFKCHGANLQLSKLDLRSRSGMLNGGEHGSAIVPGNAEASRLYRLVSGQEKPLMPLDGRLTEAQVKLRLGVPREVVLRELGY